MLIYLGERRRWKVCVSRSSGKRQSVRQRSLMSGNGQRSPLRLVAVKLGRVSQPTFSDLPFGNKFVLEPFPLSRGPAIMKAIDY